MTQQPIDPNSPEAKRLQAENLLAQAAVEQAKVNKLRSTANIISRISTWLIIGGVTIPCLCIVVLALFSGNK